MDARGESLLAAVGIGRFLLGRSRAWSPADVKRADGIPLRIARELAEFCRGPELANPPEWERFDLDEVADAIEADPNTDELTARTEGLSPDDAEVVTSAHLRALEYLRPLVPPRTLRGLVTPHKRRPPLVEKLRFGRAWLLANDPLLALADLRAGRMSPDQRRHLEGMFPALLDYTRQTLLGEFMDKVAKNSDWRLPRYKARQVETLLGQRTMSTQLEAELARTYETSRGDERMDGGGGGQLRASSSEATRVQQIQD